VSLGVVVGGSLLEEVHGSGESQPPQCEQCRVGEEGCRELVALLYIGLVALKVKNAPQGPGQQGKSAWDREPPGDQGEPNDEGVVLNAVLVPSLDAVVGIRILGTAQL
jgi:hypothetical protein